MRCFFTAFLIATLLGDIAGAFRIEEEFCMAGNLSPHATAGRRFCCALSCGQCDAAEHKCDTTGTSVGGSACCHYGKEKIDCQTTDSTGCYVENTRSVAARAAPQKEAKNIRRSHLRPRDG